MKPLDKGPFEDVMKIDGPCAHFIGKDNPGVEVDDGFSFKMIVGGICPDGAGVKVEIQHEDALCPAEQLYVNCLDLGVDTLEEVEVILRGLDNNPFKQLKSLMQKMGPIIRQFGVWQSGLEMHYDDATLDIHGREYYLRTHFLSAIAFLNKLVNIHDEGGNLCQLINDLGYFGFQYGDMGKELSRGLVELENHAIMQATHDEHTVRSIASAKSSVYRIIGTMSWILSQLCTGLWSPNAVDLALGTAVLSPAGHLSSPPGRRAILGGSDGAADLDAATGSGAAGDIQGHLDSGDGEREETQQRESDSEEHDTNGTNSDDAETNGQAENTSVDNPEDGNDPDGDPAEHVNANIAARPTVTFFIIRNFNHVRVVKAVRMYRDTPIGRALEYYCSRNEIPYWSVWFSFLGEPVWPVETPDDMGLDDDDEIFVHRY